MQKMKKIFHRGLGTRYSFNSHELINLGSRQLKLD
jgi:hypothetical protein